MIEKTLNEWLEKLSGTFGQQWQLDDNQCRLTTESGEPYINMEWLPIQQLFLIAAPLDTFSSEDSEAQTRLIQYLALNSHPDVIGKGLIALGDNDEGVYLIQALEPSALVYEKFEAKWRGFSQLVEDVKLYLADNDISSPPLGLGIRM
ncbi:type III secretion system chaperone family protein [Algicola sagamiensis]|uniref:type III secretion system chaperone n=1 Tax=Algicola sagamiensis TaxID=163869 RepID=UPI000375F88C|nr:type III secretion system chaperone [Algicola sagamiensis]